MLVKKGQKVLVAGSRGKGNYKAEATADFDTEKDEWYSVKALEDVPGSQGYIKWQVGDDMPCRNGVDSILKILEN